jgi:hypothetical protein
MRFGLRREKRLIAQEGVGREASVSPAIEQSTRLPLQEQRLHPQRVFVFEIFASFSVFRGQMNL